MQERKPHWYPPLPSRLPKDDGELMGPSTFSVSVANGIKEPPKAATVTTVKPKRGKRLDRLVKWRLSKERAAICAVRA